MVIGNVINVSTGRIIAFTALKITAKKNASVSFLISKPGTTFQMSNTAIKVIKNLNTKNINYFPCSKTPFKIAKLGIDVISGTSSEYTTLSNSSNNITLLAKSPSNGPEVIPTP